MQSGFLEEILVAKPSLGGPRGREERRGEGRGGITRGTEVHRPHEGSRISLALRKDLKQQRSILRSSLYTSLSGSSLWDGTGLGVRNSFPWFHVRSSCSFNGP